MFAFVLLHTSMASLVTSMATMQAEVATMAQQIRWQPEIMDKMGNTIPRKDTADPTSLSPEWRCTVGCDSLPDLELEGVDDYVATLAEHGMEAWEEYDYEDYGLDYGDDLDASGGNILKGLNPDALKTVSPELLASYLANATPEDLGGLLGDPATLASLPVATVVGLVQGLPWHMLLVVLESEGLRQLVATAPEDRRAREWLEGITPALVGVLEGEQLARVPDYLLEFALTSSPAMTALLDVPEKLEEVAREHPGLLQKVRLVSWCFSFQPGHLCRWVRQGWPRCWPSSPTPSSSAWPNTPGSSSSSPTTPSSPSSPGAPISSVASPGGC